MFVIHIEKRSLDISKMTPVICGFYGKKDEMVFHIDLAKKFKSFTSASLALVKLGVPMPDVPLNGITHRIIPLSQVKQI